MSSAENNKKRQKNAKLTVTEKVRKFENRHLLNKWNSNFQKYTLIVGATYRYMRTND